MKAVEQKLKTALAETRAKETELASKAIFAENGSFPRTGGQSKTSADEDSSLSVVVSRQVVLAQQPTPILLDPKLTPGDAFEATAQDICTLGYSKKVRNVPAETKREVYREYGITEHHAGDYEVDHLISLELGGSNSIKNLWPESYRTSPWNAHVKDQLEDKLHSLVCSGQLDLKTAQRVIASNWIEAYEKYVSPNPPQSETAPRRTSGVEQTSGQVWVNLPTVPSGSLIKRVVQQGNTQSDSTSQIRSPGFVLRYAGETEKRRCLIPVIA